jgi:hypothetical protein
VRALGAEVRSWPVSVRVIASVGSIAVCLGTAYAGIEPSFVFLVPDSPSYVKIAAGATREVLQPFASRQMGALLAGWIARRLGMALPYGFVVESMLALLLMLGVLYWVLDRTRSPRWMLLALAVVPFWAGQMQYLLLPDLFYSGLMAVLIVLLAQRRMLAAALMMFPLMLSRESTSLTLVCVFVAAWGSMRWRDRLTAVVAAVAGSAVVGHLTRASQTNVEHLPQAISMLAKVPWNFLRNVLGVLPWSNLNAELCTVPVWSVPVRLGGLRSVGYCGFSHIAQWELMLAVLTQFGLLPMLTVFLWWRHRHWEGRSPLLRFALLYGAASFVLAPLLGNWLAHLTGYAWPLCFVALPLLFDEFVRNRQDAKRTLAGVGFFATHLAVCAAAWMRPWQAQLVVELVLWAVGFVLLRQWWGEDAAMREAVVARAV